MTEFYAQPYNQDYTGFNFDSFESFEAGMDKLPVEEVEIQVIEADNVNVAKHVDQSNIELWFNDIEDLNDDELIAVEFLLGCGCSLDEALGQFEAVHVFHGTIEEYADEFICGVYDIPEYLEPYIDYKAFARDLEADGVVVEMEHGILVTNAGQL